MGDDEFFDAEEELASTNPFSAAFAASLPSAGDSSSSGGAAAAAGGAPLADTNPFSATFNPDKAKPVQAEESRRNALEVTAGREHIIESFPPSALSAAALPPDALKKKKGAIKAMAVDRMAHFGTDAAFANVSEGGVTFMLRAVSGVSLNEGELHYIDRIINLSQYADEEAENNAPVVNVFDRTFIATVTGVLVRNQFLIPGCDASLFTPEYVASLDYQRSCQPGPPSFSSKIPDNRTVRFTKTIIPMIYSVTIQLTFSDITDKDSLARLEELFGIKLHRVLLMERTKRNTSIQDATIKCKSILAYHNLADGSGVLVISATAILNTQLPDFAARLLSKGASFASGEVSETARLTRAYVAKTLADK